MSTFKFAIHKIRINRGGYDENGYYFGVGLPIYECHETTTNSYFHVRAANRDAAKIELDKLLATNGFYRRNS